MGTFIQHTLTTISLLKPVNNRCSSAWSAELNDTWAKRTGNPSSQSPSKSCDHLYRSTQPPPTQVSLTTPLQSILQSPHSYVAVSSLFASPTISTQLPTSLAAQSTSSPPLLPPTILSSPCPPQRQTPSRRAHPSLFLQLPVPQLALSRAFNDSTHLTPDHWNLPYLLATMACHSFMETLSRDSVTTFLL